MRFTCNANMKESMEMDANDTHTKDFGSTKEAINFTWLNNGNAIGFLSIDDCELLGREYVDTLNITCVEHAPNLTYEAEIRSVVLAVMTVLSLVGNMATIISISRDKRRSRCSVYTLILHLSVSDLFVTFACLLTESIWTYTVEWKAGNLMCKLVKYLQMFSLYVSTFILVLIGVDRFMAVRHPLKRNNTRRKCGYGIIFVWAFSGLLSIPQMIIFRVAQGPFIEEFYQCVTYGAYSQPWQEQLYTTMSLVFMFLLPLFILLASYMSTFITLQKSEKIFRKENTVFRSTCPDYNRQRLIRKAKMKALKISVVIVLAFIICWTPYYSMMLIYMFIDQKTESEISFELQKGIFFFGMSNSLINPLIYGAFHLCKCSKKPASFNLIIIQRNGPRLQYLTDGHTSLRRSSTHTSTTRASVRSTNYRSLLNNPYHSPNLRQESPRSVTSVIDVWDQGVRYSFKKPLGQKTSCTDCREDPMQNHSTASVQTTPVFLARDCCGMNNGYNKNSPPTAYLPSGSNLPIAIPEHKV